MARLYLFAEGQTEQTFADIVLKDHLAQHGTYLQAVILIAHARKKGKVHRGGGRRYQPMRNDIARLLRQEAGNDVYFSTMVDFYALHSDFPGQSEAEKLKHLPRERIRFLETAFQTDLADARFIPFLQLHEFEAYLFADPEAFRGFYPGHEAGVQALLSIVGALASPELIDDGQHTAPSKRIIQHFPDYAGAKAVLGPQLAQAIGLPTIRAKCPHFDAWLTRLESLG